MNITLGNVAAINTKPLTTVSVNPAQVRPVNIAATSAPTAAPRTSQVNLDKVQQGVNIFQDLFSTFRPSSSAAPAPAPAPAAPKQGLSTVAKVGIGAGAALLTYVAYKAFSKKKKALSGLGELNTAKTPKKRVAQRAAVFAKLDEEGKTFPKNKAGKRRKSVSRKKKRSIKSVKI